MWPCDWLPRSSLMSSCWKRTPTRWEGIKPEGWWMVQIYKNDFWRTMPRISWGLRKMPKTTKRPFKAMLGARKKQRGPLLGADGAMLADDRGMRSSLSSSLRSLLCQGKSCSKEKDILEQIFWKKSKYKKSKKPQSTCFKCFKMVLSLCSSVKYQLGV